MTKPDIKAEIARQRAAAEKKAGSAVLTLAEKRTWLARLLRVNVTALDERLDGDLLAGVDVEEATENKPRIRKLRLADKIAAMKLDNDLAGEGSEAEAQDALSALLGRVRK